MNLNNIVLKYSDMVSLALLMYINTNNLPVNAKNKMVIELTKKSKEQINHYLDEVIKNELHYGKTAILIKSCKFKDNWRNINHTKSPTYSLTDDSIYVDPTDLERFIEARWKEIEKNSRLVCLKNPKIDTYDFINVLKSQISIHYWENKELYSVIKDNNLVLNNTDKVSKDIEHLIIAVLKKKRLI